MCLLADDAPYSPAQQIARFRALFASYDDAARFSDWITYRDGEYLTDPLEAQDPMVCGSKVTPASRHGVYIVYHCEDASGPDAGCDDHLGSEGTPRKHSSEASSGEDSSTGPPDSPHIDYGHYQGGTPPYGPANYNSVPYSQPAAMPSYSPSTLPPYSAVPYPGASSTGPGSRSAPKLDRAAPAGFNVQTAPSARSAATCADRYVMEWELQLLPSESLRGQDWPATSEREEHFFRVTSALVREMAARYMPAGTSPDGERIRQLSMERSQGRISGTGCGEGPRMIATYQFVFDARWEAEHFRDWLRRDDSEYMVDALRRLDPVGVCGGEGETSRVKKEPVCV